MDARGRLPGAWRGAPVVAAVLAAVLAAELAGCDAGGGERQTPDAVATSSGSSSVATQQPASFDDVVAAVEDRVAIYDGIATGVVALVRVGRQTRVVTGGLADKAGHLPMAEDLTFPIASITKPMTATLVLQLVEEGRLGLDDDVRAWLPELGAVGEPITVEQLLSHTSGLQRDPRVADAKRVGLADTAGLVELVARRGLDFAPGSKGVYSNAGFAALGLLVERILDQPLARALDERVFKPAGMDSASLGGAPDVQGYAADGPVRNYYLQYLPGAGSVVTTAGDLDVFFRALWAGELVPEALVDDMRTSRGQVLIGIGFKPDYGLGLIRWHVSCGTAIGHSGRIGGFTDEAWTLEGQDRSVVVSVNDQDADAVARGIVETALCSG